MDWSTRLISVYYAHHLMWWVKFSVNSKCVFCFWFHNFYAVDKEITSSTRISNKKKGKGKNCLKKKVKNLLFSCKQSVTNIWIHLFTTLASSFSSFWKIVIFRWDINYSQKIISFWRMEKFIHNVSCRDEQKARRVKINVKC